MKLFTFIIVVFLFVSACINNEEETNKYIDNLCNSQLGFKVDTPTLGFLSYAIISNNEYLAIRPINFSSDTFVLRIESASKGKLNIFEYSYDKHKSFFKIYRFPMNEKSGKILFDREKDSKEKYVTVYDSKIKGAEFLALLEKNEILELPSCEKIPGYPTEIINTSVTIYYSSKCKYKMILYNNPYAFSGKFKEAKSLVNFLGYLKQEFDY